MNKKKNHEEISINRDEPVPGRNYVGTDISRQRMVTPGETGCHDDKGESGKSLRGFYELLKGKNKKNTSLLVEIGRAYLDQGKQQRLPNMHSALKM